MITGWAVEGFARGLGFGEGRRGHRKSEHDGVRTGCVLQQATIIASPTAPLNNLLQGTSGSTAKRWVPQPPPSLRPPTPPSTTHLPAPHRRVCTFVSTPSPPLPCPAPPPLHPRPVTTHSPTTDGSRHSLATLSQAHRDPLVGRWLTPDNPHPACTTPLTQPHLPSLPLSSHISSTRPLHPGPPPSPLAPFATHTAPPMTVPVPVPPSCQKNHTKTHWWDAGSLSSTRPLHSPLSSTPPHTHTTLSPVATHSPTQDSTSPFSLLLSWKRCCSTRAKVLCIRDPAKLAPACISSRPGTPG